ncbi:MFS transporter [Pseudogulbenkiania subflava]|uniref:Predicted arabinose efflux permease, MFS family n=1 Tax=Pseudogulbenkiania subflava DSM 22618 TaxID=1123014 RepID=A0A1Y6BLS8_9NEIS|nr:MFS transporter [Pseudogulbenkiania subflava]SMF17043.1 Predicted arabinose efflux permease, MFS family [Pseudogulbenkiania subflava DSM 22618]
MIVGWLTIFLVGTDLFVVSPFLPQIGHDLGREPSQLTLMVSLFSITYAIACPLQGHVAERIGVPRVLLFGVFTIALANFLTALATSVPALLASRVLAGLAAASISPMLYALAAERSALNQRATNLARINSGLVIALILGAPLGLVLGNYSGWRLVFGLLALAFLMMLPVNRFSWRASSNTRPQSSSSARAQEPLRGAVLYLVCMVLWGASIYAGYTMLAAALDAEYQLSVGGIATVLTCFGLGATIGSLQGGRMADHIGPVRMVRLCFAMMVCTNVCLYFVYQTHAVWALSINMFVLSLVAYGFFPALQATATQRFTARRPTVMGLLSSSLYIGITTGATASGFVYAAVGMLGVIALATTLALTGAGAAAFLHARP